MSVVHDYNYNLKYIVIIFFSIFSKNKSPTAIIFRSAIFFFTWVFECHRKFLGHNIIAAGELPIFGETGHWCTLIACTREKATRPWMINFSLRISPLEFLKFVNSKWSYPRISLAFSVRLFHDWNSHVMPNLAQRVVRALRTDRNPISH